MKNGFNNYNELVNRLYFCTDADEVKEGIVIAQEIHVNDSEDEQDEVLLTIETDDKVQHKVSATRCYVDIHRYRKNKPVKLSESLFCRIKGVCDSQENLCYYAIEFGQVVKHDIVIKTIYITNDECTSPEVPTDVPIYSDPDVAEQMCTTTYTDKEGVKHTCEGLLQLVMPTDEQKVAIKALEEAFTRCKELGIGFGHCIETNRLYAWNNNKAKSIDFDYEGDDHNKALIFDDAVFDNFATSISSDNIYEEYEMFVERKDDDNPQEN